MKIVAFIALALAAYAAHGIWGLRRRTARDRKRFRALCDASKLFWPKARESAREVMARQEGRAV
jgi:hypothetical protein